MNTPPGRLTGTAQGVVPVLLLAVLIARLGTDPFARSLKVLTPVSIVAALLLGVVTTTAQALRWRTVALTHGSAPELTRGRAVRECYRSALLNSVLPGGVVGDAVRAWRQRPAVSELPAPSKLPTLSELRAVRASAKAVIGERVIGTTVLLLAVGVVSFRLHLWLGATVLAGAGVAALIAVPALRRLSLRARCAVVGWSVLSLASLVTKFFVASVTLGTVHRPGDVVTLALIVLAGMSVPFGIGGFGPREAVAAVAFTAVGLSADAGVATSAGYGVLAAISAVPGGVVMLLDLLDRDRAPSRRQVELDADVVAEHETAGRRA